ncbi:MAG: DUF6134 family protein, partial [Burkholderiaceae bacterium]
MRKTAGLPWFVALAVAALTAGAAAPVHALGGEWDFRALLDGAPIGRHHFRVTEQGDERKVVTEANFAVKFLGITAYRYHHRATEQWRGDCLTALSATTDDGGTSTRVRSEHDGDALSVVSGTTAESLKGCVMSFAYWNPAIQSQTRLLNAQTGKFESVQVDRVGGGSIEVRGRPVVATRVRI